jgi:hypothetical protein
MVLVKNLTYSYLTVSAVDAAELDPVLALDCSEEYFVPMKIKKFLEF